MVVVAIQNVCSGIVSPASISYGTSFSAPDNHLATCPYCGVDPTSVRAFSRLVAVQVSVLGLYLPPSGAGALKATPYDHLAARPAAVWLLRPTGAFVAAVAVQLSVIGLYLAPVASPPPQMIISVPVQTAV